jgi:DNA (cytosine-5)-methyltransferase 1
MNIKIIDLFAGIGGIRMGFEMASTHFKSKMLNVFTSEINKFCIKTYVTNFGPTNFFGDIAQLNTKNKISKTIPDFDILLAGFPCQPFSVAGKREGFDDPRGRHFFTILNILKIKKPKAFLLENVKYLKKHNDGKTIELMLKKLRKYFYVPDPQILNAKDFGLPQNRERIFIVGFSKKNSEFSFPKIEKKKLSLGDILLKNVHNNYTISSRLWEGHKKRKLKHKKNGNGFGYSLFDKKSLSTNTLSARYYKDGCEILVCRGKNKNPRMLTERECARLQGFPDTFKIPVSKTEAYKQFGNSVPVTIIKKIATQMLKYLSNKDNRQKIAS